MTEIRAVLFDMGHTLVDFDVEAGALLKSYQDVHEFMRSHGLGGRPPPEDLILRVSQHAMNLVIASYERGEIDELDMLSLFDESFRHHGYHLEPSTVRDLLRREHAAYAQHLLLPQGTAETLQALRRNGYPIGIVSNATIPGQLMRDDLELLGLDRLVDAAVFSSEVGVRKPDRRIFEAVLDTLGVDPRHCVFVGDRLKEDVGGSRALGMHPVLTHEFRQEVPPLGESVRVIARLPEIERLVQIAA